MSVEPDVRRVTVREDITAEACAALLSAGGHSPPVYTHDSIGAGHAAGGRGAAGTARATKALRGEISGIFAAIGADVATRSFGGGESALERLLEIVRIEQGLEPSAVFTQVPVPRHGRPAPLTLSTATQLGVLPSRHLPPLLDYVLGRNQPAACRAYITELLLHPPKPEVADAILQATTAMLGLTTSLPVLETTPPAKIAKLLTEREGDA